MDLVNIADVVVHDNPTSFRNPFQFEITFQCHQELQDDLEWKIVYVGSAESQEYDQTLEEAMVGPVHVGVNRFILQAEAPNPALIPPNDILGVTIVLVSCSYLGNKFLQIGYYVNNDYNEPYDPENPPSPVNIDAVFRNVLSTEPRVTRFPIDWTGGNTPFPQAPPETNITDEEGNREEMNMNDPNCIMEEEEDDDEDDDGEEGDVEVDLEEEEGVEDEEEDEEEEDQELANMIQNDDSMDVEQMHQVRSL